MLVTKVGEKRLPMETRGLRREARERYWSDEKKKEKERGTGRSEQSTNRIDSLSRAAVTFLSYRPIPDRGAACEPPAVAFLFSPFLLYVTYLSAVVYVARLILRGVVKDVTSHCSIRHLLTSIRFRFFSSSRWPLRNTEGTLGHQAPKSGSIGTLDITREKKTYWDSSRTHKVS